MVVGKQSLFVDTSGWIEVFGKNNPLHKEARAILDRATREYRPIVTTNYVIVEFVARGCDKCRLTRDRLFEAIDVISNWPRIEIVQISKESHNIAMIFLRARLDKQWSLVDATSFNIMSSRGIIEALTTDNHFVQARFIKLL
jgi:predicted nucleic acid-binding protein